MMSELDFNRMCDFYNATPGFFAHMKLHREWYETVIVTHLAISVLKNMPPGTRKSIDSLIDVVVENFRTKSRNKKMRFPKYRARDIIVGIVTEGILSADVGPSKQRGANPGKNRVWISLNHEHPLVAQWKPRDFDAEANFIENPTLRKRTLAELGCPAHLIESGN